LRILDRYLLREFVAYSLLGIGTFVALFIVVDLFEKLDVFVDHRTALPTILRYYFYGLPATLTQILPVALLLGSLLGLSTLRKHNELTAMQGSGQSPWRLARPLLLLAGLVSLGQYGLNEFVGPPAHTRQKRIMTEEIRQQAESDKRSRSEVRLIGAGSRLWVARFYDAPQRSLRDLSVQFLDYPSLRRRIDARDAVWEAGVWRFEHGFLRAFVDSSAVIVPFRALLTNEPAEVPSDFAAGVKDPFFMGMSDLWTFARRVRESGGETQEHLTNFHIRASFPLADLIMVLLGAALSLRVVRGGNIALGFGISVSVGFAYFAFIRVGQALGYNGTLPPLLAAWLANLVFGVIGGLLFWKVAR
jgi:lipopolysaccharide export system permease protein